VLWATTQELIDFPTTLGKPVLHGTIELLDAQGKPAKAGEIGEIAVCGPTLMNDYWRQPDSHQTKMGIGWHYTGDMAWKNPDGYFFMVDRQTDMYISGGENVYPAEVERVLKEHASIDDVAVIGEDDAIWGQTGHAFVIKKPETKLTEADVRAHCERRLARFKWPDKITFCEDFPRSALGKIIKKKVALDR
jgi:fatty-acyl-CoA synthase